MKKTLVYRSVFYVMGMLLLALGLTLNTKAGLGVSPIISVAYMASVVTKINFGNMTLIWYSIFVVTEIIIHYIQKRERSVYIKDVLQLPLSIVFTRFLNVFGELFPDFATIYAGQFWGEIPGRLIILLIALLFTGIGAAMTVDMRVVPNPGDGIVQAISDVVHKEIGFTKNCVDVCCLTFTAVLSKLYTGSFIGVGIGTVIAMIAVGRVIYFFNRLFLKELQKLGGLSA